MRYITDIPFGIRYVGCYRKKIYGNQYPIKNTKELKNIVDEHLGISDIAISTTVDKDGSPYLLFLPFDFDSDILRDAWNDAKKLFNMMSNYGYESYLIFSVEIKKRKKVM